MGAPKQKWSPEEEAALKAGIAKYGTGKWSTILKDPEFGPILHMRSNVDLKDKWRNINVAANGFGSRHRVNVASRNNHKAVKLDDMSVSTAGQNNQEVFDAVPLAALSGTSEDDGTKKPMARLDNLILDTIVKLKEPRGSSRGTIAIYIEEKYFAPPNLDKLLSAALKQLTENGQLIKVKHRYRIAPPNSAVVAIRTDVSKSVPEGLQKSSPEVEKNEIRVLSKSQADAELEKMKSMTAEEAAAAAALAVAEAEAAIAEAEKAAREAEQAEAEAEAAQLFADAAMSALKCSPSSLSRNQESRKSW